MTIAARRLRTGDVAAFRALNAMFAEAFEDPESYGGNPPDDAWLENLLARDDIVVLTADAGSRLAGGLVAYRLDKFEQRRSEFYLYDLAVALPHRRRGIARALIAELQAIAFETGVWAIYVQADHGDDPAIALYESLGTREDVLHFDIAPNARG